ncbi:hypothetical protein J1N35_039147 [Gossypium stocksii]|uniref:Uncharacterized protein n=1 Tax=Gossypium stocksii TaxID=47602 RepID=A0A9D3ZNB9_9ROSI|nr:hypothetical protein J1N35_039147 [Gossypium stocksii]
MEMRDEQGFKKKIARKILSLETAIVRTDWMVKRRIESINGVQPFAMTGFPSSYDLILLVRGLSLFNLRVWVQG